MYRDRPFRYKLIGLLIGLVGCILLIWLMLAHPQQFLKMIGP
jgi:hypothetical protein